MPRDTRTGAVLEAMVLPALVQGGYQYDTQVVVGLRPNGRTHRVDVVAQDSKAHKYIISLKWQQTSGTAEQKVPYEVICLGDLVTGRACKKAYLVLGGPRWTLRDFYTQGGLKNYMPHASRVEIVSLEDFVAQANQGKL